MTFHDLPSSLHDHRTPPRSSIAQMATGEGKSIVISMLAIFAVQLHGMRVHILENNEGLLDRDYQTNKPFFEAFGIKCGIDLLDESCQVRRGACLPLPHRTSIPHVAGPPHPPLTPRPPHPLLTPHAHARGRSSTA